MPIRLEILTPFIFRIFAFSLTFLTLIGLNLGIGLLDVICCVGVASVIKKFERTFVAGSVFFLFCIFTLISFDFALPDFQISNFKFQILYLRSCLFFYSAFVIIKYLHFTQQKTIHAESLFSGIVFGSISGQVINIIFHFYFGIERVGFILISYSSHIYGATCSFLAITALINLFNGAENKRIWIILLLVSCMSIAVTGSRLGIIIFITVAFMQFCYDVAGRRFLFRGLVGIFILIICSLLVLLNSFYVEFRDIVASISIPLSRALYFNFSIDGSAHDRFSLVEYAFDVVFRDLMVGSSRLYQVGFDWIDSSLISMVSRYGIFGIFLFFLLVFLVSGVLSIFGKIASALIIILLGLFSEFLFIGPFIHTVFFCSIAILVNNWRTRLG